VIYRDGDPLGQIPVLRALSRSAADLAGRAQELLTQLGGSPSPTLGLARIVDTESFADSGANPAHPIPSKAIALPGGEKVCAALRDGPGVPVFARIAEGEVLLDLRTLDDENLVFVGQQVRDKLAAAGC
jgi:L-seryl-tRNA(Ser) seleniumtransferase